MTLSFSSSTPADGSVDFQVNKNIELVFNKSISTTSLAESPISLVDIGTGLPVPCTLARHELDYTKVIVSPTVSLRENSQFRIVILGYSSSMGYYLRASDGEYLITTVEVVFSTGDNAYKIDTTLEKEAQSLTLEGDLFLPTNVKALGYDFTVEYVRPKNDSYNLSGSLTGDNTVQFTFSKTLYTGDELDTWVDINVYPILDTTDYLASGQTLNLGTNTEIAIPGYTLSVTGETLTVSFDSEVPKNTIININLLDKIRSSDNEYYGGKMVYNSVTELFPSVPAIETVKREVRAAAVDFTNVYIASLIFKNTMWLWERVGRSLTTTNFSYPARQYVVYSTALDIIEDKDLEKFLLSGSRRQLADLNVSYDNLIGRLAMKASRLQESKMRAFETLFKGWQIKTGISQGYIDAAASINRLWYDITGRYTSSFYKYYQPNEPMANVSIARQAKTTNPYWFL